MYLTHTLAGWRKVVVAVVLAFTTQVIPVTVPTSFATSLSSTTPAEGCVSGAGKRVAKIAAGTALFVFADCLFFACGFTVAALATAGAASVGVATAAGALAVKGGMAAAAIGCVEGVSDRR